jgi:predicted porin
LEGFAAEFSRKYDDMSVLVTAGHYNNLLTGGQLVLNLKDILKLDITAGAGYYKYNMDNNKEVFVEVVPFGLPVTLTGDYTWSDSLNLKDNESWLAGFEIGKKPVSVYANYRSLNSKSVNMDLTDDDFIDDGHEVGVKYQFTENVMTDVNILTKDFDDKNYRIKTDLIFQF